MQYFRNILKAQAIYLSVQWPGIATVSCFLCFTVGMVPATAAAVMEAFNVLCLTSNSMLRNVRLNCFLCDLKIQWWWGGIRRAYKGRRLFKRVRSRKHWRGVGVLRSTDDMRIVRTCLTHRSASVIRRRFLLLLTLPLGEFQHLAKHQLKTWVEREPGKTAFQQSSVDGWSCISC